jgi:glycosyltransferase involved in cell wall biosynthesis
LSVTVIIPCHNEAATIRATISSLRAIDADMNIVVVDNASEDDTAIIASKEKVHVLHEPILGKGFAFRRGISAIRDGDLAIFMIDGDDTYGLENLHQAFELVSTQGYDMVVGTRKASFSGESGRQDAFRPGHTFGNYFLSRPLTKCFQLIFRTHYRVGG